MPRAQRRAQVGKGRVLGREREPQEEPCSLRLSGSERDPGRSASPGERMRHSSPSSADRAAAIGSAPKIARASSVRPLPTRPARPDDLARSNVARDVLQEAFGREVLNGGARPERLVLAVLRSGMFGLHRAPEHGSDDRGRGLAGRRGRLHQQAVPQDRHVVRDREHLLEEVGDVGRSSFPRRGVP